MIEILEPTKIEMGDFRGWPGGLRGALGGNTRGVQNANGERKFMFGDFFFNFWPQLAPRRPNKEKETKKSQ